MRGEYQAFFGKKAGERGGGYFGCGLADDFDAYRFGEISIPRPIAENVFFAAFDIDVDQVYMWQIGAGERIRDRDYRYGVVCVRPDHLARRSTTGSVGARQFQRGSMLNIQ